MNCRKTPHNIPTSTLTYILIRQITTIPNNPPLRILPLCTIKSYLYKELPKAIRHTTFDSSCCRLSRSRTALPKRKSGNLKHVRAPGPRVTEWRKTIWQISYWPEYADFFNIFHRFERSRNLCVTTYTLIVFFLKPNKFGEIFSSLRALGSRFAKNINL